MYLLDVWSAGCVLAELLLGQPIFPGDSGVDQLVEIIKVLGTPTREQIKEMNPNYTEFKFPQIKSHPWQKVCDRLVFTFFYLFICIELHFNIIRIIRSFQLSIFGLYSFSSTKYALTYYIINQP